MKRTTFKLAPFWDVWVVSVALDNGQRKPSQLRGTRALFANPERENRNLMRKRLCHVGKRDQLFSTRSN
jgi:hypothetical protein